MKQMAQSIVQHVAGVERVVNRIEVARSPHMRGDEPFALAVTCDRPIRRVFVGRHVMDNTQATARGQT